MQTRAYVLPIVLCVLGACSGKDEVRTNQGAGTPRLDALLDLYREALRAKCEFDERCVTENGRGFASLAVCLSEAEMLVDVLELVFEQDGYVEQIAVRPGADVGACADSLYPANSCDPVQGELLTPECQDAIEYVNEVPPGGLCYGGETNKRAYCAQGTSCAVEESGCGYCDETVSLANGSACVNASECDSGFCIGTVCSEPKPRGASCAAAGECRGYLRCIGQPGASFCDDAPSEGEPCEGVNGCLSGLNCRGEPSVCVQHAPDGTTCDRTGSVNCAYLCVFDAPDAATGKCGYSLQKIGEACAYMGAMAACGDGEPRRTIGTDGEDSACVCAERGLGGGACRSHFDCASYSCRGYVPGDPGVGTCDPFRQIGEPCSTSLNCASSVCGAEDGLCAPPPVCQ